MKTFFKIVLLSACLVAAHVQASEPENKRLDGCSFLAGVGTAVGIPIIAFGHALHRVGKKEIARSRLRQVGQSNDAYRHAKEAILIGRCLKGAGASLMVIPFLAIYHRQLFPFLYKQSYMV